jgi:hypothetical protein
VKLKRHDGRIRRCKMLLRKRNNVLCMQLDRSMARYEGMGGHP